MSKNLSAALLLAGSSLLAPAIAHATTPVGPVKGIYATSAYINSAETTNGGTCATAPAGSNVAGLFAYPGPGKTGAMLRYLLAGPEGPTVFALSFPATPAAGVGTWSGTATGTTGATGFTAAFTAIDSQSFTGTFTFTYAISPTSNCVTTVVNAFARSGK